MLRTFVRFAAPLLATAAVTACVAPENDGEDTDDVVLGGKADGALDITPAEHAHMIHVARWTETRKLVNEVGLTRRAAESIERARLGADGYRGNSDDTYFRTIEQLDALPYIGRVSLEKLRDYVRTLEEFPADASERWHVRSGTSITTNVDYGLGNRWAARPAFAIDRDGALLALYMTSADDLVLEIDGERIAVPRADDLVEFQWDTLHLAVDEANTIHLFFAIRVDLQPHYQHLTYANGAWTEHPALDATTLQVAQGQGGEVYTLASGRRYVVELTRFHADGTSSVEELRDMTGSGERSLAVAADGTPVIAWTPNEHLSAPAAFYYRRVTAAGPVVTRTDFPRETWYSGHRIYVGATQTPTIMITPHWGAPYIARDTGAGFTPVTAEDNMIDHSVKFAGAMSDTNGVTTSCAVGSDSNTLVEATIDASGHAELRTIIDIWASGVAAQYCDMTTDAQGKAHLIYGTGGHYIHATLD